MVSVLYLVKVVVFLRGSQLENIGVNGGKENEGRGQGLGTVVV